MFIARPVVCADRFKFENSCATWVPESVSAGAASRELPVTLADLSFSFAALVHMHPFRDPYTPSHRRVIQTGTDGCTTNDRNVLETLQVFVLEIGWSDASKRAGRSRRSIHRDDASLVIANTCTDGVSRTYCFQRLTKRYRTDRSGTLWVATELDRKV